MRHRQSEVPLDQCAKEALRKLWGALVENPRDHQRYYRAGRFPLRVRIGGQRGENVQSPKTVSLLKRAAIGPFKTFQTIVPEPE